MLTNLCLECRLHLHAVGGFIEHISLVMEHRRGNVCFDPALRLRDAVVGCANAPGEPKIKGSSVPHVFIGLLDNLGTIHCAGGEV